MSYHELSATERATIQIGLSNGFSQRRLARLMNRSPSTVSREIRRNRNAQGGYVADDAQRSMHARRVVCRPRKRLVPGNELFELVIHLLRQHYSPEQIAGKLRSMNTPSFEDAYVCRETIYNAIYALPAGELRKELIICLRQGSPGEHSLQTRVGFEVSSSNLGRTDAEVWRTCIVQVDYDGFSAGQRYQLEARPYGFRAMARLRDSSGQVVARGRLVRCGI